MVASEGDSGLRRAVRAALESGARTILINLEHVPAIDSSGVSDLVACHTIVNSRGGRLKICNLSQKLKDILVVTRLSATFDTYETEDEALSG